MSATVKKKINGSTDDKHTVPSPLTDSDCQQIEASVTRSLQKRKEVVALLTTLEEAWKAAVSPELSKPENITSRDSPQLQEAQTKKIETTKLKRVIFLSFESLTKLKHEDQVNLGQEILRSLPAKKLGDMILITDKTQLFFEQENAINKEFLKEVEKVSSNTDLFIKKIQRVIELKCQDPILDSLLTKDLRILNSFLKATKKLFNG